MITELQAVTDINSILKTYLKEKGSLSITDIPEEDKEKVSLLVAELMALAYEKGANNTNNIKELKHKKGKPTVIEYKGMRYVLDNR